MFITILTIIAIVALLIFLNGLYVAAEFATVAARRTRISQLAGQGHRIAQALLPVMENSRKLDKYVATCQVGITISSLVLGAYAQRAIAPLLLEPLTTLIEFLDPLWTTLGINSQVGVAAAAAQSVAVTGVLIAITVLQVIMGELFPKSVAIQYPETLALALVAPMRVSEWILTPFIKVFNGSGNLILRLLGREAKEKSGYAHSPEEIELLVTESHESGLLADQERQMLRNAFRLRDLTARQVMIHRTRLMAAPVDSSVLDLLNKAIDGGYSRIPLYEESIDNIIGFVHVKDLFCLRVEGRENVREIIRDVVYVPETMPIYDVWEKLNTRRKYLAIVFDEYGGTAGLITFEDLIEEIFGELQDEFDDEMALIARDKNGRVYLRGDLLVADVNEYLELNLPTEAADTLSGLIRSELGRPPVDGEEVAVGGTAIRVEKMADLGVSEISLQLPPSEGIALYSEWEVAEHE